MLVDRRILIADLAYLGDTLMTSPVITNLRRNHPRALIDFLVADSSAVVVRHNPDLNEVIEVDKGQWNQNRVGDLFDLAARLREKKYDTAFIVHRAARTALLIWLAKIPRRIGLATQGRRLLLTDALPLDETKHRTDNALALLEAAGEHVSTRGLAFTPAPGAPHRAEGLMLSRGWDVQQPLIALAPGGSWETKRWPLERFAKAAQWLQGAGYQVALVGGPGEFEMGQWLQEQLGTPALDLIGATTFDELYEVFTRCHGVISNDSGPMHLAAAAGVPTVGIFGPTSPERCGPVSEWGASVAGEVPCLGCYFKTCEHLSCMHSLGVRPVMEQLQVLMEQSGLIQVDIPEPERVG